MAEQVQQQSKKSSLFCCGCGDRESQGEQLIALQPKNPEANTRKQMVVLHKTDSLTVAETNGHIPHVSFHYLDGKRPVSARANVPVIPITLTDKNKPDILKLSQNGATNPESGNIVVNHATNNVLTQLPPYQWPHEKHEVAVKDMARNNAQKKAHEGVRGHLPVKVEQVQPMASPPVEIKAEKILNCVIKPTMEARPHSSQNRPSSIPKIYFTYETPRKSYVQQHFIIPNHLIIHQKITNSHSTAVNNSTVTKPQAPVQPISTDFKHKFKLSEVVNPTPATVSEILPTYETPNNLSVARSPKDKLE